MSHHCYWLVGLLRSCSGAMARHCCPFGGGEQGCGSRWWRWSLALPGSASPPSFWHHQLLSWSLVNHYGKQLIHDPRVRYPFPCCHPQFILLPAALRHVIGGGLAIAVRGWSSDEPRGLKSKL